MSMKKILFLQVDDDPTYHSFHPVLSILSFLCKAPLVPPGTPVINALFRQRACIENILRACVGLSPVNHMFLEHKADTLVSSFLKQTSHNGVHMKGDSKCELSNGSMFSTPHILNGAQEDNGKKMMNGFSNGLVGEGENTKVLMNGFGVDIHSMK